MHILFFTDNFPPEVNAPASRTFEHCREWVRAGHQVTVLTCAPNFPQGRVYPGYANRPLTVETLEGIRVLRVWTYIAANAGFGRRIADYLSFMVSAVAASLTVRAPDVIVSTSPQFFAACGAFAASRLKGAPFVFELRDLWPESIKAVGAMGDSAVMRLLEKVELFLYRRASRVVTVTEAFKRNLVARGIPAGKIHVVLNGVDRTRFQPQPRDAALAARYGLNGKFVAGYIGTHGLAHALETLLEAARRLQNGAHGERFRFLFLGNGARKDALKAAARRWRLDNVVFIDTVPKDQVVRYWGLLDAAVIHLKRTPLFTTVIPSKLFEAMGMGVPVLHGVQGESADIVTREGAGLCFTPENADELVGHLLTLAGDPGLYRRLQQNCTRAAAHYDRDRLAADMRRVLEACARDRHG